MRLAAFVVAVGCSSPCAPGAGQPYATSQHPITSDQRAMLAPDGGTDLAACDRLCAAYDISGPADAGIDSGVLGARASECTISADGSTLTCTYVRGLCR